MGSAADQYHDQPAGVLICFGIPRLNAPYFDFEGQNFLILQLFFYTLYSYYMVRSLRFFTIIYLLAS